MTNKNQSIALMFKCKQYFNYIRKHNDESEIVADHMIIDFMNAFENCTEDEKPILAYIFKNITKTKRDENDLWYIPNIEAYQGRQYFEYIFLNPELQTMIQQLENYVTGKPIDFEVEFDLDKV